MKIQRILLLFFSLLWLQACSVVSGPVHLYSGQPRPNSETAQLRVPGPITVKKIDGREVKVPSIEDGFYEIYLLPGQHRIDFKYELDWGASNSGMFIKSDVVSVQTQFSAGMNYELTYPIPQDEDEAYDMSLKFKATLLEKKTGRLVASRTMAEFGAFNMKAPIVASTKDTIRSKDSSVPVTASAIVKVPADINADTVAREDTVKRLKFWWLIANEKERKRFKKWMKLIENVE